MAQNNVFQTSNETVQPYVVIREQPASNSHIFRYASEIADREADRTEVRRKAGSILGVSSTASLKTYPTIQVMNYKGSYDVVVSCVSNDGPPYRPHPHNLIGTADCKDGIFKKRVRNNNWPFSLKNVAIERVKKRDVRTSLEKREILMTDPYGTGFHPTNIDLKAVRLCFQVFISSPDNRCSHRLEPVVSDTIIDKKGVRHLTIVELSHFSASVTGGTKVILLCDRVDKNNIEIWFYEKQDERILWESKAQFGINNVHKSVAISFKTPPYHDRNIQKAVSVLVELRKPRENESGEPREFVFIPEGRDLEELARKRPKALEILDNLALPEFQPPIGVPRMTGIFHQRNRVDSSDGNVPVLVTMSCESYPQPSTSSDMTTVPAAVIDSSNNNLVTECYDVGNPFSPTTETHLHPVHLDDHAQPSVAHQQASVTSHAIPIMQQFPETVNTYDANFNACIDLYLPCMDAGFNGQQLPSLFDAQSFPDITYQDPPSSSTNQQQ